MYLAYRKNFNGRLFKATLSLCGFNHLNCLGSKISLNPLLYLSSRFVVHPVYLLSSCIIPRNYASTAARAAPCAARYTNPLHPLRLYSRRTRMRIRGLHAITEPTTKPSGQLAHFRITFDVLLDRLNLAIRARARDEDIISLPSPIETLSTLQI